MLTEQIASANRQISLLVALKETTALSRGCPGSVDDGLGLLRGHASCAFVSWLPLGLFHPL